MALRNTKSTPSILYPADAVTYAKRGDNYSPAMRVTSDKVLLYAVFPKIIPCDVAVSDYLAPSDSVFKLLPIG